MCWNIILIYVIGMQQKIVFFFCFVGIFNTLLVSTLQIGLFILSMLLFNFMSELDFFPLCWREILWKICSFEFRDRVIGDTLNFLMWVILLSLLQLERNNDWPDFFDFERLTEFFIKLTCWTLPLLFLSSSLWGGFGFSF